MLICFFQAKMGSPANFVIRDEYLLDPKVSMFRIGVISRYT